MVVPSFHSPSLTEEVLTGNPQFIVKPELYEEAVAPLFKKLIAKGVDPNTEFDPERHISFTDDYYEKTDKLTLEDIGLLDPIQAPISRIAVTDPFPLFSEEAVDIMRYELFKREAFIGAGRVLNHSTTGDADCIVRGFAEKYAPFTLAAWNHPRTVDIMSKMFECDVVSLFPYEDGSANVCIRTKDSTIIDKDKKFQDPMDIPQVLSWHHDSPQVSCVLMLSDTTEMIGGETVLMKADGSLAKVSGPKQGWACLLQGRIIRHCAQKPLGDFSERITAVQSLRPRDPLLVNSPITTLKPSKMSGSRYNEFYQSYMNYRLDVLKQRVDILQDKINESVTSGKYFNQLDTIEFLQKKIVEFVENTWQEFEVVDDGLVAKPKSYNVSIARWE